MTEPTQESQAPETYAPALLCVRFDGKIYTFETRKQMRAFVDGACWATSAQTGHPVGVGALGCNAETMERRGFEAVHATEAVGREVVAVEGIFAGEVQVLPSPYTAARAEWFHGFSYFVWDTEGVKHQTSGMGRVWVRKGEGK